MGTRDCWRVHTLRITAMDLVYLSLTFWPFGWGRVLCLELRKWYQWSLGRLLVCPWINLVNCVNEQDYLQVRRNKYSHKKLAGLRETDCWWRNSYIPNPFVHSHVSGCYKSSWNSLSWWARSYSHLEKEFLRRTSAFLSRYLVWATRPYRISFTGIRTPS